MDKDRAREQKRASATRVPFARRQHKLLSSVHLSGCNGKRHNLSGPVTATGEDTGAGSPADGWKKEKATSDSGGSSSNDDGAGMGRGGGGGCRSGEGDKEPRTPPIASTSSSKKRVKLNGKLPDGYAGVDPAVVPRKLRSAVSKRFSGSLSPSFPNGRKKDHLASNSGNLPLSRVVEVTGSLTKDEEDAVETLSALAQMVTDGKPTQVCVNSIPKPEKLDSRASTSANDEVATGSTEELYCPEKLLDEPEGPIHIAGSGMPKQASPPVVQECRKLYLELNQPAQVDTREFAVMKIDSNVDLNDSTDLSASGSVEPVPQLLPVPQLFLENGVRDPPKTAPSLQKPDITAEPLEYSSCTLSLESKCQEKVERVTLVTSREEVNLGMRIALPVGTGGQPDVACCSSEPGPSRTLTSAEKIPMLSSGRRQAWKKCATHVYIGYLIRHCQLTDRKSHMPTPCKRPKLEPIAVINEVSRLQIGIRSLSSKETDNRIVDEKPYEMKNGPLHDKKPVQQLQNMPGLHSQPKQNCDLLALSVGSEFPKPGSKMEPATKFSSTNLTSMAPHPSVVSFSLPPPYSAPYPDQLAAAATVQQVQLQLPPQYLATPFYGFHMGHMGGPTKQQTQQQQQQQQLWQAHVTQYWMPPVLPKWQNGRPFDPSQPLIPGGQMQPVFVPSPVEAKGVVTSHHRPAAIQHQVLPIPLQAANRPK